MAFMSLTEDFCPYSYEVITLVESLTLFTATYFHSKMHFAVESTVIVKIAQITNKTEDPSVQALAMSKFEFG